MCMKAINKAIFIDLDGTLVRRGDVLTERTLKAVKHAQSKGYEIVICTGRAFNRTETIAAAVGARYIIYADGACIFDLQEQKALYENPMSPAEVVRICKLAELESLYNAPLSDVKTLLVSGKTRYFLKDFTLSFKPSIPDIVLKEPLEKFLDKHKVLKIVIFSYDHNATKTIRDTIDQTLIDDNAKFFLGHQSKWLYDQNMPKAEYAFVDYNNKNSTKGDGVKIFCQMFNIPKQNTIAIGDDLNDFSMFAVCGQGVAMGNSLPQLKELATHVTDSENNDGVAKFLETL